MGQVKPESVVALTSAFSCLVSVLTKVGYFETSQFVEAMQRTASVHRMNGTNAIADEIHYLAEVRA